MSPVTPSRGRPGYSEQGAASPERSETIRRPWTFLQTLSVKALRIFGGGGIAGQLLVAEDDDGNIGFTSTLPATTFSATGQTLTQTATLVNPALGEYVVTLYTEVTTVGAAGTLDTSLSYNDDASAVTIYPLVGLSLAALGRDQAVVTLRCASGGIDYLYNVTGGAGSAYAGFISITKVR